MSLREMPQYFTCDTCDTRLHVDLLCAVRVDWIVCVHCCQCESHRLDDPDGTVIWPL